MMDGLIKKLMAKKVLAKVEFKPGVARAFNYADGTAQEYWIDRILVGKEVPSFAPVSQAKLPQGGESYEPAKRGPGRPANQTV